MTADWTPPRRRNPQHRTAELEAAVMDRHDRHMSPEAIAADLGCALRTVEAVLSYMTFTRADQCMRPVTITASTDRLLAAIARHHPERIVE